jgi:hypothetical protein
MLGLTTVLQIIECPLQVCKFEPNRFDQSPSGCAPAHEASFGERMQVVHVDTGHYLFFGVQFVQITMLDHSRTVRLLQQFSLQDFWMAIDVVNLIQTILMPFEEPQANRFHHDLISGIKVQETIGLKSLGPS